MERNLVKHGESTLMLSLPKKWLNKYNLSKGDKILIKETEEGLVLSTADIKPMNKAIVIRTDYLTKRTLTKALITAYIKGYNMIKLQYRLGEILDSKTQNKHHVNDMVNEILRDIIGMEITGSGKGELILSDVSGANENRFDTIIERLFDLIKTLYANINQAISSGDLGEVHRIQMEIKNARRFAHLALRLVNKHNFPYPSFRSDFLGIITSFDEMLDTLLHWTSGEWDGILKKLGRISKGALTDLCELPKMLQELHNEYSNQLSTAITKQTRKVFHTVQEEWSHVNQGETRLMQSIISINARFYFILGRIVGL